MRLRPVWLGFEHVLKGVEHDRMGFCPVLLEFGNILTGVGHGWMGLQPVWLGFGNVFTGGWTWLGEPSTCLVGVRECPNGGLAE